MKKIVSIAIAALLALALLAGCGSKENTNTTTGNNAQTSGEAVSDKVSGTVSTDGSTSMEKVIGALGEAFTANNPVSDITVETVAKIYKGEITNWKDLGGDDAEIAVIGREAGSGTRDGFESVTGTKDACKYRQELTSTGDVITTVANNPNAIGYASLAAVKDTVKALSVEGVAPSEETVKDGSYVVQRPFVLVTKTDTPLSAAAQKFFDFATSSEASDIISKAGAVPVK